jgi:hypothetical protein
MELGPCSSKFRGKGFGCHSDVVPLLLDLLEPLPGKPDGSGAAARQENT